jgi:hypothetical protein
MLSTQDLQQLKDADFYHLPELSDYASSLLFRFVSGPNYRNSLDNLQVTKSSAQDKWDMTAITNPIPSSGIHHLKLKIVSSRGAIMVGVCPAWINLSSFLHCGWYFFCGTGKLFSGPPQKAYEKSYYSTSAIGTGREVGVKMDMTNGQISFTVDGVNRGVAFTDIPLDETLYFCVLMRHEHDSVKIMRY